MKPSTQACADTQLFGQIMSQILLQDRVIIFTLIKINSKFIFLKEALNSGLSSGLVAGVLLWS